MLLAKSRIPLVATGIIILLGLVLFFMAGRASADNAAGDIPSGAFTNTATDLSWSSTFNGVTGDLTVCAVFGNTWTGAAKAAHDIEVFLVPVAGMDPLADPKAATFEGPVLAATTGLADNTFAVNTMYCLSNALINVGAAHLIGLGAAPATVGIHILDVTNTLIDTSSAPVAANAATGTGPSIVNVGWDWTYDSRGLQVCLNRGASWAGVADDIQVWADAVLAGTITVLPAADTISCSVIAGVATAPAAVALSVRDAADNTIGILPAPVATDRLILADMGWDFQAETDAVRVRVKLGATLPAVHEIEVYPNPSPGDSPALTAAPSGGLALSPGQVLNLDIFDLAAVTTSVRVQFLDANGVLITLASGGSVGVHANQLVPTAPAPPPVVVATPITITEVPSADVTVVTEPTNGRVAIIQPSTGGSVSAPDGGVVVSLPVEVHDTTFQLAYNPSPVSGVPVAPAGTAILRAFELNAHDTTGAQVSLSLLKAATITVKYTDADVAAAPGKSPLNLIILRYDAATQAWTQLNTIVDLASQTLTAKVSRFSLFGLGGVVPAPQFVPPTGLPVTGDYAPGSGLLLALVLAGFLLIVAGGAYLAQARRARG